jgi:hypothetical protein
LAVGLGALVTLTLAFPMDPGSATSWAAHLAEGVAYAGLVAIVCIHPLRELARSARSLTVPRTIPVPAASTAD